MAETIFDVLLRKLDTLTRDINDLKRIEFPVYVDGDGNGIAGRVAEWSDTKNITAAKLVGPSSNVLTLAAGGAYTLTVPATGTAALGAGTLTAATSNSFTGSNHTHAITASASPGSSASLLKTDSNGRLTLHLLTVGSGNLVLSSNLTNQGGNGVLNWDGNYTLTIGATGSATLGAGTLTVSTSNNAGIANHTHAITSSYNPGSNASLLKTDGSGGLTLNNLTISQNNITLNGKTLTVSATGTATLGAGTLTVSTSNNAGITNHTHAITSSSNPGSNASILASNGSGGLALQSLTLGGNVVPTGAGTLTVSTSNNAGIANHTHAITHGWYATAWTGLLSSSGGKLVLGQLFTSGEIIAGGTSPAGYILDAHGACHATSFPTSSDRRLKKNLKTIDNVLERMKKVNPITFDWNKTYVDMGRSLGKREYGLIAQEVQSVFPELVSEWNHPKKYLAIDYGRAVSILWQAIKELTARIEKLEAA